MALADLIAKAQVISIVSDNAIRPSHSLSENSAPVCVRKSKSILRSSTATRRSSRTVHPPLASNRWESNNTTNVRIRPTTLDGRVTTSPIMPVRRAWTTANTTVVHSKKEQLPRMPSIDAKPPKMPMRGM